MEAELMRRPVLYSRRCKYAIRAAVFLATRPGGAVCTEIAGRCGLSPSFLASILQAMVRKGMLYSSKGSNGGFALRRPAREIRLLDMVNAIDEGDGHAGCALGYPQCSCDSPCALHDSWAPVRRRIQSYLQGTTIADLAQAADRLEQERARLTVE